MAYVITTINQSVSLYYLIIQGACVGFMCRVAKVDELTSTRSRLLSGFRHELEWIRRPPFHEKSKVVANIISAHQTERLAAYVKAGCRHPHTAAEKIAQFHTWKLDLVENLARTKNVIDELECLAEDTASVMDSVFKHGQDASIQKEDEPQALPLLDVSEYRLMTEIIVYIYRHDYTMQEKVILSVTTESATEELESYCLMFGLRPYVNEGFMQGAGKIVS